MIGKTFMATTAGSGSLLVDETLVNRCAVALVIALVVLMLSKAASYWRK